MTAGLMYADRRSQWLPQRSCARAEGRNLYVRLAVKRPPKNGQDQKERLHWSPTLCLWKFVIIYQLRTRKRGSSSKGRCRYAAENAPKLTSGRFATVCFGRRGIATQNNPANIIVQESPYDLDSIDVHVGYSIGACLVLGDLPASVILVTVGEMRVSFSVHPCKI